MSKLGSQRRIEKRVIFCSMTPRGNVSSVVYLLLIVVIHFKSNPTLLAVVEVCNKTYSKVLSEMSSRGSISRLGPRENRGTPRWLFGYCGVIPAEITR